MNRPDTLKQVEVTSDQRIKILQMQRLMRNIVMAYGSFSPMFSESDIPDLADGVLVLHESVRDVPALDI